MRYVLQRLIRIISICALLYATSALFAQTRPPDSSLTANPVYEKNCAKCHGKTAEGRHFGGPSLLSTTSTIDQLHNAIVNGKGRMPKYAGKLTPEEIDTLVQQITALNKK